jgi:glutamate dehydrogenase (NADP+)
MRLSWSREEVDGRLRKIMTDIHARCVAEGSGDGPKVDYLKGSNLAGFKKVAGAMLAYGAV